MVELVSALAKIGRPVRHDLVITFFENAKYMAHARPASTGLAHRQRIEDSLDHDNKTYGIVQLIEDRIRGLKL